MEDRYLFRAKRIDNGEWAQGCLFEFMDEIYIFENPYSSKDLTHKVDKATICQCTGLKDKSGNLIWENDVASYSDLITRDKKVICIEWNRTQAQFVRKYRSPMGLQYLYLDEYIASGMEIVGNIFDNPKLLEEQG